MIATYTDLDHQIQFLREKIAWNIEHGKHEDVLAMYNSILESLYRLKNLEE